MRCLEHASSNQEVGSSSLSGRATFHSFNDLAIGARYFRGTAFRMCNGCVPAVPSAESESESLAVQDAVSCTASARGDELERARAPVRTRDGAFP
jgi:hypothetical protein